MSHSLMHTEEDGLQEAEVVVLGKGLRAWPQLEQGNPKRSAERRYHGPARGGLPFKQVEKGHEKHA